VPALPAAEIAAHYVPDAPRLAWSMDTGAGLLAPVTTRGPAFFATTTNRLVVAVAAETGRRFWYQRFDSPINTGVEIENGRLYFATEHLKGEAFALDATRGRKVWSRRIGPTRLRPTIAGNLVLFATDQGSLYALTKERGEVRWQARFPARLVLPPVLTGNKVVTGAANDSLYAIDPNSGSVLQRSVLPARPLARPLIVGDTMFVVLVDSTVAAVNTVTLSLLFQAKFEGLSFAPPQAIGGRVYVLTQNAEVYRLEQQTLQRIVALGSAASASFKAVGSRLIVGLLDGRVVALDENGGRVWEYQAARSIVVPVTPITDGLLVALKNGGVLKLR
jgi:outer membrane protein assembly factor BamB